MIPHTSDRGHKERMRKFESGGTNCTQYNEEDVDHSGGLARLDSNPVFIPADFRPLMNQYKGPLDTIICEKDIDMVVDNKDELKDKKRLWQKATAISGLASK